MTQNEDLDQPRLIAAVELIGRSAANELELGWEDDAGPRPGEWYASARYRGTRVIVEEQEGPIEAAEALAAKLIAGGTCVHCGKTTTITVEGLGTATVAGHPELDEDVVDGAGKLPNLCIFTRDGEHWLRGCDGGSGPPPGGMNRDQRRRQQRAKDLRR